MGGRSRSSQRTENRQSTTNVNNEGDLAGAVNSSIDESDNSIEDSFNNELRIEDSFNTTNEFTDESDNSINDAFNTTFNDDSDSSINDAFNTTTTFNDDSDSSINDAFNTTDESDNSVNDSFNTTITNELTDESDNSVDNSIQIENDGEFAGNNGTINFVDAGAIAAARDVALSAVSASESVASIVTQSANDALDSSLGTIANLSEGLASEINATATNAIEEVSDFGQNALGVIAGVNKASLNEVNNNSRLAFEFGNDAIDALSQNTNAVLVENSALVGGLADNLQDVTAQTIAGLNQQAALFQSGLESQSADFSDNIARLNQLTNDSNNRVLTAISDNASANTEVISQLASSTSTGGQTVVAEASQNIALGLVVVVGFVGVAFAFRGSK